MIYRFVISKNAIFSHSMKIQVRFSLLQNRDSRVMRLAAILALALLAIGLFGIVPTSRGQTQDDSLVNVQTFKTTGQNIYGSRVTLWQNGTLDNSCLSPCAILVSDEVHYQVAVSNHRNECFASWNAPPGSPGANTTRFQDIYFAQGSSVVPLHAYFKSCIDLHRL